MTENYHGWVIIAIALNIHMKKNPNKQKSVAIEHPTQISMKTTLY